MKLDTLGNQDVAALATHILERTHKELGYSVAGIHFMLQSFAKSRPDDLRAFLRIVVEECA